MISDSVCGIHHLERPASRWNLRVCLWFVVVTFSTVGYGEYTPNDWPAQTFVMIMIAVALILLPVEVGSVKKLNGIVISSGMLILLMANCYFHYYCFECLQFGKVHPHYNEHLVYV